MKEEILIRFITGQLSSEEETEVIQWVESSPENREDYYRIQNLWALSSQKKPFEKAGQNDIELFQQVLHNKKKSNINRQIGIWAKYAAVIMIAFFAGKIIFQTKDSGEDKKLLSNQIVVPLGSKSKVQLPDGTEIVLNAGSKLTYDFNYGKKNREVTLIGEGYFKVAKHKEKPFIVHTSKASIKALGTEFNVKAYPDENAVEALLVEGSIQIDKVNTTNNKTPADDAVVLKPGQKVHIIYPEKLSNSMLKMEIASEKDNQGEEKVVKENFITEESNIQIATSWKETRWIIQGETLDNMAVLLSRRFNVKIQLQDAELKKYRFSATIQNETIEQIFSIMKLAIPMTYTIDKGNVVWYFNRTVEKDYIEAYQKK